VNVARKLPAGEAPICLPEMLAAEKLDMDSLVGRVLDWLSLPSNQRWLLVIDNVDRGYSEKGQDSQAYDVMRYCPKADHGNILITSRLSTLRPPQHSLCLGSVDRAQGLAILESTGGDIVPGVSNRRQCTITFIHTVSDTISQKRSLVMWTPFSTCLVAFR
jgi:hypothetical protein